MFQSFMILVLTLCVTSWAGANDVQAQNSPGQPNLSDRLQENQGVITPPPNNTPDIRVPAPNPNPGTTPVIPPEQIAPQPNQPNSGTGSQAR